MSNKIVYTNIKFAVDAKPKGFWVLYPDADIQSMITVYSKPTYAQIKKTKELLGWGWRDAT